MEIIAVADVPSDVADRLDAGTLQTMVDGLNAKATRVAPCLDGSDAGALAEARLILLGALGRWSKAGEGAVTQQGAGPFQQTVDTRQARTGWQLWPSEIDELQALCGPTVGKAFEIDTTPADAPGVLGVDYWWSTTTDRYYLP